MARWSVLLAVCAACGRIDFGEVGSDSSNEVGADSSIPPASPAATYASAVMADTPVAYFHFDETGGTTATSAVGSVTGQYEGTFGFGSTGAMVGSRAVTFDGATTRIDLGDRFPFAGTVPYSLELWLRPTAIGSARFIIDRRTTATPAEGYTMYMGTGYLIGSRIAGGIETSYVNYMSPSTGAWIYVVVTWDGSVPLEYINGIEVSNNQGGPTTIGGGAGNFVIGDLTTTQTFKLEGDLDELAIYDHALTGTRVAAHYAAAQ